MPGMIPKILHYCFGLSPDFGGKPWSLIHHVCVKSAVERIRPEKVYFWCEHVPTGPWWRLTERIVDVRQISAPREIFGNALLHPAHRADVLRLEKLLEYGGIYLDADVFIHRDFNDLLAHSVLMGKEAELGLCNAVILAEPGAPFLLRWHDEFKSFRSKGRDEFWGEHAVTVPWLLSKQFPSEVSVLPPAAFHWPLWDDWGIERIFNSVEPITAPEVYANHLWEAQAWENYLQDLTPDRVRRFDSNFHFWARPMLEGLPDHYGAPRLTVRAAGNVKTAARNLSPPRRALRPLWDAASWGIATFFPEGKLAQRYRRWTFHHTYERRLWGSQTGHRYFSGVGSEGEPARIYVDSITRIIAEAAKELGNDPTVVDLGCGDFRIGAELVKRLPSIHYVGCDIVPGLVAEHNRRHIGERISFRCLDIVSEDLPEGDIYLIRQVLQHLPNRDVASVLAKLRTHPRVYVTEGQPISREGPVNPDMLVGAGVRFDWRTGRGRGLELDEPPFNVPVEEVCRASVDPKFSKEVIVTFRLRQVSGQPPA